jgi:hypothetical protein
MSRKLQRKSTDMITLKKYVADVTEARGAQWLNGVLSDEYMKSLITVSVLDCGIH